MSVKTDPVSPAPDHTPPLEEDAANPSVGKKFNQAWSRWFVSLREKVNVINDVVASLSDLVGGGFIVVDGGEAIPREIRGTAGRIEVTNGDGLAGDPTIDVVTGNIIAGANVTISGDTSNRLVGAGNITISSTGGGGGGSVTIPIILDNVPSIFDSDATNHLVDMPDTVNTGDLLLCIFTNDGDATVTL